MIQDSYPIEDARDHRPNSPPPHHHHHRFLEQTVLLRVLSRGLDVGCTQAQRSIYVECLFAPLLALMVDHKTLVMPVLALVEKVRQLPLVRPDAAAALALPNRLYESLSPIWPVVAVLNQSIYSSKDLTQWLFHIVAQLTHGRIQSKQDVTTFATTTTPLSSCSSSTSSFSSPPPFDCHSYPFDLFVVLSCAAFLFDTRLEVQQEALATARVCIATWPIAGPAFVPSCLYLLGQSSSSSLSMTSNPNYCIIGASFTLEILYTLVETASSTTVIKSLLRTVKALSQVNQPLAVRLLFRIWSFESRVYPQLESLLSEQHDMEHENDTAMNHTMKLEWQVCQLYTILELCQVRGDLGLHFIHKIQLALECPLPSLAAIAVACVRALCVADCLDFATACKILASKTKKNKV